MTGLRITRGEAGEWIEIRPQRHGERRVAGRIKLVEQSPERVVAHTRYAPGLLIERHSHLANEVIFVIAGELRVDGERCGAGTTLVLEQGTPFGPVEAGPEGAELFECFDGPPGHVSLDDDGFLALLAARGITLLPETHASLPDQGRTLAGALPPDQPGVSRGSGEAR
ncbi:MAG: hypothetical protein R3F35_12775 [Myxococcota bacterium]